MLLFGAGLRLPNLCPLIGDRPVRDHLHLQPLPHPSEFALVEVLARSRTVASWMRCTLAVPVADDVLKSGASRAIQVATGRPARRTRSRRSRIAIAATKSRQSSKRCAASAPGRSTRTYRFRPRMGDATDQELDFRSGTARRRSHHHVGQCPERVAADALAVRTLPCRSTISATPAPTRCRQRPSRRSSLTAGRARDRRQRQRVGSGR